MKRRKFSAEFKKKVTLEVLKERKTLQEIATEYQVAPSQVSRWKDELINGITDIFKSDSSKDNKKIKELENKETNLHQKIGQLTVEVDFLKKKLNQ